MHIIKTKIQYNAATQLKLHLGIEKASHSDPKKASTKHSVSHFFWLNKHVAHVYLASVTASH